MHAELPYREVHTDPPIVDTEPAPRPVEVVKEKPAPLSHPMARRLLTLVAVLAIIGLAYLVYVRWVAARNADVGNVQLLGDPDSNSKVVVDKSELNNLRDKAENAIKPETTTVTTQTTTPAASTPANTTLVIPATDSIPANPTNGMVFSGTGRYQLYRQGSITWRLDTDSGHACIIFATDEQWRLQRVYSHGCGND
jgi:hypothetical protein